MPNIVLNNDLVTEALQRGVKFNQVLEERYFNELTDYRKHSALKDKSATKLALIDNGIYGNSRFENLFKKEDNEFLYPAYMADIIDTTIKKSDVSQFLVGQEIGIDQTVVKAPTVDMLSDENRKKLRRKAVAEGAEFPMATIKTGTASTELFKKGIGIQQTYESARALTVDLVTMMLTAVSNDIVEQNVEAVINTLENSTITELKKTSTADKITNGEVIDAIVGYKIKYGYMPDTFVCGEELFKELFKMTYGNTESAGITSSFSMAFPQMGVTNINIVLGEVSKKGGKNRILVYNKAYAIIRYVQNGSALTEYDTKIINQTNQIVLSEISGYANFVNCVGEIVSA